MSKDRKIGSVNQDNKRESFVFYRSFYEAINAMPEESQLVLFKAIFSYSLDFKSPNLNGIENTVWLLIKPQLDANIKKYKNGCKGAIHGFKGGRPKTPKETSKEPQVKSTETGNVNVYIDIHTDFHKQLKEEKEKHASWAQTLSKKHKIKKGFLTNLIREFELHLKTQGKVHTSMRDYKSHLNYWIGNEISRGRLKEFIENKIGAQ